MKKKGLWIVVLLMLAALTFGIVGCADGNEPSDGPGGSVTLTASVTLDKTSGRLDLYETLTITATVQNTDEQVEWSSSDPSVATVVGGVVSSVAEGTATITASAGEASATCEIEVYDSKEVPVLALGGIGEDKIISIDRNENATYSVTVKTRWKGNDLNEAISYTWALAPDEADNIAEFQTEQNGAKVTFTGTHFGEAKFTVTATVHGQLISETLTVKVVDLSVVVSSSTLESAAGGFVAELSLAKKSGADYVLESVETGITVKEEGVTVAESEITYSVESGEEYITFDPAHPSAVTAKAEGSAVIKGSYGEVEFYINVSVVRPEMTLDDDGERFSIEILKGGVIALPEALVGTVSSAKFGDADVFDNYDEAKDELVLDTEKFPIAARELGDGVITLNTDRVKYLLNVHVVTMYIDGAAALDSFITASREAGIIDDANHNNVVGYYEVTQDFTYVGTYSDKSFIYGGDLNDDAIRNGFAGTFEGNGHVITDLTVSQKGLFGHVKSTAIIQNISFVNASKTAGEKGQCTFFASMALGTFKNIYLELNDFASDDDTADSSWNYVSLIFGMASKINATNVIIDFIGIDETYGHKTPVLSSGTEYANKLTNLMTVGVSGFIRGEDYSAKENCGAAVSWGAAKSAGVDFGKFTEDDGADFWVLMNGLPVPKALSQKAGYTEVNITNGSAEKTQVTPISGKFTVQATGHYKVFTVTGEDCTVDGYGVVTVSPALLANGGDFSVTVTSAVDSSKTFTANYFIMSTVEKTMSAAVEYKSLTGVTFTLDFTNLGIEEITDNTQYALCRTGGVTSAIGFGTPTFANGELTLSASDLTNHWGVNTVTVLLDKKDDSGTVIGSVSITVTLKVVTMYISDTETLNSFIPYAREAGLYVTFGENSTNVGGYFEVTQDFTWDAGQVYNLDSTYGGGAEADSSIWNGFAGTFEGNGHKIGNLVVGKCGVFGGTVSTAVIRNIYFENATKQTDENVGTFFGACTRGLYENIFVELNDFKADGSGWTDSSLIFGMDTSVAANNVIICFKSLSNEGAAHNPMITSNKQGSASFTNVFVIGATRDGGDTSGVSFAESWQSAGENVTGMYQAFYGDESGFWGEQDGHPFPKAYISE